MSRAARPSIEDRCRDLLSFDRAFGAVPDPSERPAKPSRPLCLVGFDEAGRGAWAGPVAVGCVHLPACLSDDDLVGFLAGVDDSKRLSPATRARLFDRIAECARYAVGFACAAEIDRIGIVSACRRAAARAYRRLGIPADVTLCDRGLTLDAGQGLTARGAAPHRSPGTVEITGGDGKSLHIAAASIVAKVSRDTWMGRLERTWPGYDLARHKVRHKGPSQSYSQPGDLSPSPAYLPSRPPRSESLVLLTLFAARTILLANRVAGGGS